MASGAPDWTSSTIQLSVGGIPVAIAAGNNYYAVKATLTSGQDPTYTPAFGLKNFAFKATVNMVIQLNNAANDVIDIEANDYYYFESLNVTSIIVTNTNAGDVWLWGSD